MSADLVDKPSRVPWRADITRRALKNLALHWQVAIALVLGVVIGLLIHLDDAASREQWVRPFDWAAELFLRLLKMLIVPLIFSSIVAGVLRVGRLVDLWRLGWKTVLFYVSSSLLAILTGLALVNVLRPGVGAELQFREQVGRDWAADRSLFDVFLRAIPENVFGAMATNGAVLQVIFFAILLGIFITRVERRHRETLTGFFEAAFAVMTQIAEFVIRLVPIGVLALMARVVGTSGLAPFRSLAWLIATVAIALLFHALVTLPIILRVVGRVSPLAWARAVWPALVTAFSTSSSNSTLPVTLREVEGRGGVSIRTTSFVLPLGATINMDGTALYECVGVIFLGQYYAASGGYELGLTTQVVVVLVALLASIGAAGIPSAGTVMMAMILHQIGLPDEGIALLLAIDRPLDMLRTAVNVWSDTCCAAVVARSEGEEDIPPRAPPMGAGGTGGEVATGSTR